MTNENPSEMREENAAADFFHNIPDEISPYNQEDKREKETDFFRNDYGESDNGNDTDKNAPAEKVLWAKELYGWLETMIQSIVAAFLLIAFAANLSVVVGSSMEPTLKENDRLLVIQCFYKPNYGDIVALWADNLLNGETGEKGELIVKRVIGLPGDEIDINAVSGVVYRNGEPLHEDYIMETIDPDCLGNVHYPVIVDENCVFVLGDNRNKSTDSRYGKNDNTPYYVGCVDMRFIVGKAVYRIYPFERMGALE